MKESGGMNGYITKRGSEADAPYCVAEPQAGDVFVSIEISLSSLSAFI